MKIIFRKKGNLFVLGLLPLFLIAAMMLGILFTAQQAQTRVGDACTILPGNSNDGIRTYINADHFRAYLNPPYRTESCAVVGVNNATQCDELAAFCTSPGFNPFYRPDDLNKCLLILQYWRCNGQEASVNPAATATSGRTDNCTSEMCQSGVCAASIRDTNLCPAMCGNNYLDKGEQCDEGSANGTLDHCTSLCRIPVCGDSIVNLRVEQCDEGPLNGQLGHCTEKCRNPVCGDATVNTTSEQCDEGTELNGQPDHCTSTCQNPTCGDGLVNSSIEECDEGTLNGQTGHCTLSCKNPVCGDGVVNRSAEQCDDGTANGQFGHCSSSCLNPVCGDGLVNRSAEQCDEGSTLNGQLGHCTATCQNPRCGDGTVNTSTEQCDEATINGQIGHCTTTCQNPVCGDGMVNTSSEQCDEGRMNGQLGHCTATCQNPTCGDGIVNSTAEQCDEGTLNGQPDHCRSDCRTPTCGDALVNTSAEQCDEGTSLNGQPGHCRADCRNPVCGDALVNTSSEQCDEGTLNGQANHCSATCQNPVCGDGLINRTAEQCDFVSGVAFFRSASHPSDAVCRPSSSTAAPCTYCGDGNIDTAAGEQCDDGVNNGQTGRCLSNCNNPPPPPQCGDSIREGNEECDLGTVNNNGVACNPNCTLPRCGDGILQSGETCEFDPNRRPLTTGCRTIGTTDECTMCGDSIHQTSETCDPSAPASANGCSTGQTCVSDTATCGRCVTPPAPCGNGILDAGEACDPAATTPSCNSTSSCTTLCTCQPNPVVEVPNCGNRIIEGAECEPPNTNVCDANCRTIVPVQEQTPVAPPVVTQPTEPTPAVAAPEEYRIQGSGGCSLSLLNQSSGSSVLFALISIVGMFSFRFRK